MRFLVLIICLQVSLHMLWAAPTAIEQRHDQQLGPEFFQSLVERAGQLRAMFLDVKGEKSQIVLYGRFRPDLAAFDLRLKLPATGEKYLTKKVRLLPKMRFWARRRDGSILYKRGLMFRGHVGSVRVEYVSHYEEEEQPYLCDAGHLRLMIWSYEDLLRKKGVWQSILASILQPTFVRVAKVVPFDKYYFNRPSYFGHVQEYLGQGPLLDDFIALPITHKVTLNKAVRDWSKKGVADRKLCLRLLQPFAPLLSQDERVKLELVPDFVRLRPIHLSQSDLACGQNVYVFFTAGTGINYFDDPWQSERKNIPSPRFIFDQSLAFYDEVQLYPSYAIATDGGHNSRFAEINELQGEKALDEARLNGRPAFMDLARRAEYWHELEEQLGNYGLLNDSPVLELEGGFQFWQQSFRGNVVNNELRLTGAAYPLYESSALIVPKGQRQAYLSGYASLVSTGAALPYIGGVHYRDYFIEAVADTDQAMRCAVFEEMVRRCRPTLWQLLRRARKKDDGFVFYYRVAKMGDKLFARLKRKFYSSRAIARDKQRRHHWQRWMKQRRCGKDEVPAKQRFLKAYKEWRVSE